jgi:hypothetical protein
VLHIIALSLIALQFLVLTLKRQERVVAAAIGIGCLFAVLAPFVWRVNFPAKLGLFLGNYFNNRQGSLFPAFPWAAFTFFGYAVAHFFMRAHKAGRESRFIMRLAALSMGTVVVAMGLYASPLRIFPETSFWLTSPSWLFTRAAIVCFLLTAMWYYEHGLATGRFSVVRAFGQQSLLVYTMHMAMIYGTFGLPKLSYANYHHLSFGLSIGTAVLILLVMFILVQWWNRPRAERKAHWKILAAAAAVWGGAALGWEWLIDRLEPAAAMASSLVMSVIQAL